MVINIVKARGNSGFFRCIKNMLKNNNIFALFELLVRSAHES